MKEFMQAFLPKGSSHAQDGRTATQPSRKSSVAFHPPSPAADHSNNILPGNGGGGGVLTDRFGRVHRYLRISIGERCNLRCTYCMPHDGIPLTPNEKLLTSDEIIRAAGIFARLGVRKIRLTGGEPTLRPDLVDLIGRLRDLSPSIDTLAMTTNGVVLERMLLDLHRAGLTHLNISLDTLQPSRFESISRRPPSAWHRTWAAIQAAAASGRFKKVKINVVVSRGVNDDEVPDFVALTSSLPGGVDVRFIELMPFAGNGYAPSQTVGWREMVAAVQAKYPDFAPIPDEESAKAGEEGENEGSTAKLWRLPANTSKMSGRGGRVGFIPTLTDAFCGTCDRLRLTADGAIKACLHGNEEHSIRSALRGGASDDEIIAIIARSVRGKHAALGGVSGSTTTSRSSSSSSSVSTRNRTSSNSVSSRNRTSDYQKNNNDNADENDDGRAVMEGLARQAEAGGGTDKIAKWGQEKEETRADGASLRARPMIKIGG